jgi:hypothetical protein
VIGRIEALPLRTRSYGHQEYLNGRVVMKLCEDLLPPIRRKSAINLTEDDAIFMQKSGHEIKASFPK